MENGNYKRDLLRQLISAATGGAANKGLHEVINAIKTALGAYKNFAKEWDNVDGAAKGAAEGAGQGAMLKQMVKPPMGAMPMPNQPPMMPKPPVQNLQPPMTGPIQPPQGQGEPRPPMLPPQGLGQ